MMPSWSNRLRISLLAALMVLAMLGVFGFLSSNSPAVAQGTLTNPTNVTAVSNAAGELTLTWQGGDNADSFLLIAVHLETIAYETETVAGGVAKTGTVTGLTGGANYLGIVVALQASADGLATQYGAARPVAVSEHLPADVEQLMCPIPGRTVSPRPVPTVRGDYDADDDGSIEVANLAQLDAMRYDRGGRGSPSDEDLVSYYGAFPNAVAGMGCPEEGCTGYELVADLDFDTNGNGRPDSGDAYWNDGVGWLPINYDSDLDGGGHTIANLYINRGQDDDVGLFGSTGNGEIRSVALTSTNVMGGNSVGGLVGLIRHGSVSDSCVAGVVSGGSSVGGLVGSDSGSISISDSYATGTVTGSGDNVGGLIGSGSGSISDSYATGTVTGSGNRVGGLIGSSSGSISDSYATGTVTGSGNRVGGLIGSGSGSISDSYATGTVTGNGYTVGGYGGDDYYDADLVTAISHTVGGLVGEGYSISISDSYATGAVTSSSSRVGGLVGYSYSSGYSSGSGSISDSYATGSVTGSSDTVGGLVGEGSINISDSYATGAVTGSGNRVGGLVGSGRNISDSYATGSVTGRGNNVGGLVGSGSASGSYATGAVTGSGDNVGGLVGSGSASGSYATGAVTGRGNNVGGLVGSGSGSIRWSYATGAVTSSGNNVGGLVGGLLGSSSTISGSYATGAVTSSGNNVGGLVGGLLGSRSTISGSYATGAVSGAFQVGGLAGSSSGDISYSYAVGRVSGSGAVGGLIGDNTGTVTDSYWDTVTSGQSHSDGGQGKTTSELQSPTGYSGIYTNWNADLDNADRDRNPMTGGDDPWDFGTSSQYPVLKYGGLNVAQQRR